MSAISEQAAIFGMNIDRVTLREAVGRIGRWMTERSLCRYVVTPNLDHVVQFQKNDRLREAYSRASLVVADGWPLVTASRFFASPLPERVAGSDLVPAIFDATQESEAGGEPRTVFLLGAAPGVADAAAARIEELWPAVRVVGTHSPPFGFENDPEAQQEILRQVNACSPDLLIVGFGAPKQELWLRDFQEQISAGVAIAGGATIDFLAGRQTRAPRWVRQIRLEWMHRLMTNPRRLAGRYANNFMQLPRLLYREHSYRRLARKTPGPALT